jgi:hypothetical protein
MNIAGVGHGDMQMLHQCHIVLLTEHLKLPVERRGMQTFNGGSVLKTALAGETALARAQNDANGHGRVAKTWKGRSVRETRPAEGAAVVQKATLKKQHRIRVEDDF